MPASVALTMFGWLSSPTTCISRAKRASISRLRARSLRATNDHAAIQVDMPRLVDFPHPAAAQVLDELVLRQRGRKPRRCSRRTGAPRRGPAHADAPRKRLETRKRSRPDCRKSDTAKSSPRREFRRCWVVYRAVNEFCESGGNGNRGNERADAKARRRKDSQSDKGGTHRFKGWCAGCGNVRGRLVWTGNDRFHSGGGSAPPCLLRATLEQVVGSQQRTNVAVVHPSPLPQTFPESHTTGRSERNERIV